MGLGPRRLASLVWDVRLMSTVNFKIRLINQPNFGEYQDNGSKSSLRSRVPSLKACGSLLRRLGPNPFLLREMGGAARNPAPVNHLLVWIVKPSGCNCTDALGGKTYRRVPTPLRSTSPISGLPKPSRNAPEERLGCGENEVNTNGVHGSTQTVPLSKKTGNVEESPLVPSPFVSFGLAAPNIYVSIS